MLSSSQTPAAPADFSHLLYKSLHLRVPDFQPSLMQQGGLLGSLALALPRHSQPRAAAAAAAAPVPLPAAATSSPLPAKVCSKKNKS